MDEWVGGWMTQWANGRTGGTTSISSIVTAVLGGALAESYLDTSECADRQWREWVGLVPFT